jgi:hypothetical protein
MQGKKSKIIFKTKLFKIGSWTILSLPKSASAKLPSRGQTMVEGTMNGVFFKAVLEPDGRGSHWFRFDNLSTQVKAGPPASDMLKALRAGDTVEVSLELTHEWLDPKVPADLKKALSASPKAHALWKDITPLARWDWIRWIRAVKTPETRQKHIEVALDKLNRGMRRPCCFNRNLCSEPYVVSNHWVLREPAQ